MKLSEHSVWNETSALKYFPSVPQHYTSNPITTACMSLHISENIRCVFWCERMKFTIIMTLSRAISWRHGRWKVLSRGSNCREISFAQLRIREKCCSTKRLIAYYQNFKSSRKGSMSHFRRQCKRTCSLTLTRICELNYPTLNSVFAHNSTQDRRPQGSQWCPVPPLEIGAPPFHV